MSWSSTTTANPEAANISALVRRLVHRTQSKGNANASWNPQMESTYRYSLRVLGSRMYPSVVKDNFHMCEQIKKYLVRESQNENSSKESKGSFVSDALRFDELFTQLLNRSVMSEKWSALYLLYSLRGLSRVNLAGNVAPLPEVCVGLQNLTNPDESEITSRQPHASTSALTSASSQREHHRSEAAPRERKSLRLINTSYDIPEERLLREIVFVFQGIDGELIKYNPKLDCFAVIPEAGVSMPTRTLVQHICEVGWMFRRVRNYVSKTLNSPAVALVEQAFCGAIQEELTDFYRLVAVLESQVGIENGNTTTGRSGGAQFTLKRIYVWIQQPLERLRILAMLTDAAKGLKGGSLASAIGMHLRHGSPSVLSFVRRIMRQVCKPIFAMIHEWVQMGELHDPFGEFFVAVNEAVTNSRLWQAKYTLRRDMVPSFLSNELANKILLIGKSINFARICCQDTKWKQVPIHALEYDDDFSRLEAAIDKASEITNTRVRDLLFTKFNFPSHCLAAKKYLLLGQGDFIQHLLDLLHTELDKPAKDIYRHNLMSVLHAAVRGSNAQFEDQDILDRLSVRLLKASDGDCGWDVFSLDYLVDSPLNVIFSSTAVNKYLRVFNFMWRLKRVEHSLASTWMRHMSHSFKLRELPQLQAVLVRGHAIRNEMNHFIQNLNHYMMFEVLECAWKDLEDDMKHAQDLDQLIRAHNNYLNTIVDKALMGGSAAILLLHLTKMFDIIIRFGYLQDRLYDAALAEIERRDKAKQLARERSEAGGWGQEADDELLEEEKLNTIINQMTREFHLQLQVVERKYHSLLFNFLDALHKHPGQLRQSSKSITDDTKSTPSAPVASFSDNLEFLAFRLDFNEFYKDAKKKKKRIRKSSNTSRTG